MVERTRERLKASMMRIRGDHPFFATLGLFATFHVDDSVATAATDGKEIWLNPDFVAKLDANCFAGLVVHELLHAALEHCLRRKEREALIWNIAADIVVNGIIIDDSDYSLPEGAVVDQNLCNLSVEEVYEQLIISKGEIPSLTLVDLRESVSDGPDVEQQRREISSYWRSALSQAAAIARSSGKGFGSHGLGALREIDEFFNPSLSWRELLWQHVISTPVDYSGFDRRFVWQGIYLDDVVGEKVKVAIAIDTSGSISQNDLTQFVSELQGMFAAYPDLEGLLFYSDVNLYGPYEFSRYDEIAVPTGGGGTSFVEFFNDISKHYASDSPVCIYFTDGYGQFPSQMPELDIIWAISSGGIPSDQIPFGKVVRMGL